MNVSYSSIGRDITMHADLSEMSNRDKHNLLHQLLMESGIVGKMSPAMDAEFDKLFAEAFKGGK